MNIMAHNETWLSIPVKRLEKRQNTKSLVFNRTPRETQRKIGGTLVESARAHTLHHVHNKVAQ